MNAPRRLTFVITEFQVGGAERCLAQLVLSLDPTRFTPSVICLAPRPEGHQAALVNRLESAGVPVHFLGGRSWRDTVRTLRQLIRRLRADPPRLVQTFMYHANVLGSIAARIAGVPRVVAGIRVADPSRFRQWVERWVAGRWDRAVCVSQSVAAFLKERLRVREERIVVIPNGLDLARYPDPAGPVARTDLGVPADRPLVLTVARLHRQKGIDWLLEALPLILARVPDCELVLVGRGPAQAELEAQADRLGIGSRVHFLGWRSDVSRLLRSADLFVLPSRWEGMPNGVLEAMASGLPVVATEAEGVRELLGAETPLQMVSFGDTPGFVDRICTFLENPELALRLGDHNRQRVRSHFTLDRMVEQYQDLYEALLREC